MKNSAAKRIASGRRRETVGKGIDQRGFGRQRWGLLIALSQRGKQNVLNSKDL
jgi:hypothetical protein